MKLITLLQEELVQEAATTRKMLSIVPTEKLDWQPHPKSMKMGVLAAHIAELTAWVEMVLTTSELDFANNPYEPKDVKNTAELLAFFEQSLAKGIKALEDNDEEEFWEEWTLRNGDQIFKTSSKYEVIRMCYCQIVHHRAQLGVYLRLLNIPIPGSYGPSADEVMM
ncbi:DinB family protein [Flavobacterium supellecticarium]|uniref:DinB family protein n=1 Tax=Flavobacterium supellecticarium TaxID=2565924 RepID=A0A4S3ZZS9_9FLAO|nr:DinB family protein [Flavobacterium supellecticarium]THF51524.1 DinB family protein [Flavobacterium supellecticarium]